MLHDNMQSFLMLKLVIQWPWGAKIPGTSLLWCQIFVDPQYGTFSLSPSRCQEFLRWHLCFWQMCAHVQLSQNC